MELRNIGLMSPGDMGQAIAGQLKAKGFNVLTALGARSARTQGLGRAAGLTDVGTLAALTQQCDLVISVMNPGSAVDFARELAAAMQATGKHPVLLEGNAVSPDTVREIEKIVAAAGGRVMDGGIIGPPPRNAGKIRLYVSGPGAAALEALGTDAISVRVVSERIGDASAVKMCYGAVTKGILGLGLQLFMAAERMGVAEPLMAEVKASRQDIYDFVMGGLPVMPPKAYRWVPEMNEIAATFAAQGLTPKMLEGAAELYAFVADTPLGKETPENRDQSRTGADVVKQLAGMR
jgi:3-hydroxyisobutyrate dehydrogenase-like beta-hydroxyacid dehydrogenase